MISLKKRRLHHPHLPKKDRNNKRTTQGTTTGRTKVQMHAIQEKTHFLPYVLYYLENLCRCLRGQAGSGQPRKHSGVGVCDNASEISPQWRAKRQSWRSLNLVHVQRQGGGSRDPK